jgi:hypothetical protein
MLLFADWQAQGGFSRGTETPSNNQAMLSLLFGRRIQVQGWQVYATHTEQVDSNRSKTRLRPSHDMAEPGADNMNSRRKRIVNGRAKSHVEARRH